MLGIARAGDDMLCVLSVVEPEVHHVAVGNDVGGASPFVIPG
jgi:hypothetical protein